MSSKRKYLGAAIAVALVALVAGRLTPLLGRADSAVGFAHAAPQPQGVQVDAATIVSKTIMDRQSYSGRLEAVDKVDIRPLVSGTILAVHFKDDAFVNKGDLLFTIDPRPYAAEVDRAKAQLAAAQASCAYTAAELSRAQRLLADNAIAKRHFDEKEHAALEASANLQAARAALEAARLNLDHTRILAPVSGRMSRAQITTGNIVASGSGAPVLATLMSVSPIFASFDMDERTYLRFLEHDGKDHVTAWLALSDEDAYSRRGAITSVDNHLDTGSGTIRVSARFDNPDGSLIPGLFARVRIEGGAPHPAVMIDDRAVVTDQDKKFVFVLDAQNHAQYREIAPGDLHDGLRVVTHGLQPNDRIVVNGLQRLHPGDLVKPNMVQMAGASATGPNP
ncbi:hypothetical protein WI73_12815 [Burkholderia ubonensis]|uniref:Uncharacterized protein n=1 Tax=Burkholderia ubonensis TaxID=101571 RepID=A0A102LKY5_9BURK|nr:efflux RND transporter periplasmic adaptor subunit [Burkholderia ubonensis]KUZ65731.1 hypothetical protein WI35_22970 [Burkholderia ubonensis]KUZ94899.1 hypothetical protein WI40_18410 [Burkholderia ubonensis]KUZ95629.1 hypothetical protein WI38_04990 [Burkholderia ubonensis]KVA00108.1 hypothetical protein WI39_05820 [Burkholderia ubonensis]KVC70825.1 hypothetical protein WI73_12815 [Burkholderia ubonensis]